jgi:hypothetical protein
MGLESATYIHQLNPSNPVGAVDPKAQGDDHLRMIKSTLQATFPTINGPVTVTLANLNQWGGLSANYAWTGQHSYTQQIRAADGVLGAPGISFAADLDTGFYRVGGNNIGVSINGVFNVSFNTTFGMQAFLPVAFADGAVATPSITFTNDPDTGLYRGGTNTLVLTVGGTQTLVTTIAQTYLNTGVFSVPDGGAGAPSLGFINDPDTGFYRWGADAFAATSGGNAVMSWRLGQSRINDGSVGSPALCFENDTDTGLYRIANNTIGISTNGTNRVLIDASAFYSRLPNAGVDGNPSLPTYTFENDTNTGFYSVAADDIGMSLGGVAYRVGYRNIPQNIQNANYTALATDTGKHILHGNGAGAGHTHTIPSNASVPYDIGTAITFINRDSNVISIAITTDTMILAGSVSTGTRTLAQNGIATAIKVAATTWMISGTGIS